MTANTRTMNTETTGTGTPEDEVAPASATRRAATDQRATKHRTRAATGAEHSGHSGLSGDEDPTAESRRRLAVRTVEPNGTLIPPLPLPVRDIVLLLARVTLGVVFLAHGLQKLGQGVAGTAEGFGQMGIPLPEIAAVFAMAAEIGGGVLLLLGLLTPLAALLPAIVMAGATAVHLGNGIFVSEGGWELAATLAVGALVLAVVGPGRLSLDELIARARR